MKLVLIFICINLHVNSLSIQSVSASDNFNATEINKLLNHEKKELKKLNAEIKKQKNWRWYNAEF